MRNTFRRTTIGVLILLGVAGLVGYIIYLSPQLANNERLIAKRYGFAAKISGIRKELGLPVTDYCGETGMPILAANLRVL